MPERVRSLLRGAGSLLDLFPAPGRYQEFLPQGTVEERLGSHWKRVGDYIAGAAWSFHDENQVSKKDGKNGEEGRPARGQP